MTQPTPATVLVVEDDLDLRATIVESLEASGFAAAQASDAADAIERLQGFAYDGLVVDLKLPDADGMTVLDEALARYPLIRAVVITGFGGVEEAVTAIRRGAVDFLIKPFQLSQLSRVLRTSMEQLRLREENASLKAQLHERFRFDNIVGRHQSVQTLFSTLELVAPMNSVPRCASSKRPTRLAIAPVKAPFTWPKSSASASGSGIAAALNATKRWSARGLLW